MIFKSYKNFIHDWQKFRTFIRNYGRALDKLHNRKGSENAKIRNKVPEPVS